MSVNRHIHTESAALTRADATTRGNDYNIGASNVYGNLNLQDQRGQHITNIYGARTDDLDSLKGSLSPEAEFDSSVQDPDRKCHPGTREGVLTTLRNWANNPNSKERICWLFSPAGAGKSAIAQTIARSYKRPKIAATFFFKSDAKRNDGKRLFPTLTYQLAFSMPGIRGHIAKSLSERPGLPNAGIETQFEELLVRPFHAVEVNPNILKQYRKLAPVIIIDGIDECTDENLQRLFLRVIGDAVTNSYFPLRFLIVSRPEVHIKQAIRRFQNPILNIDLAKLEDANRDVEKYLVDEFSRIASEKDLDSTWPDKKFIDDIVYKSSSNFIFASLVIRFVGDPYGYPPTQLDIVLNIKMPETASPLAPLDQLYLEILKRVPNQDFQKKYLALFTARISVQDGSCLLEDDAMIMDVSQQELHANLSRMCSILKFDREKGIDLHHKSLLDFLYDSSRSGLYHVPQPSGGRRFVELFIDSLIRHMSTLIERPDHIPHYCPSGFASMIKYVPLNFKLPTNEWLGVILPLLDIQDKLLQLPNFASYITSSSTFRMSQDLLLRGLYHGIFDEGKDVVVQSVTSVRKRGGIVSSTKTKMDKKNTAEKLNHLNDLLSLFSQLRIWSLKKSVINGDKLDGLLLSLFRQLPETIEGWSPDKRVINLTKKILSFNYAKTATRVQFVSDAQKIMDLLDYLINEKDVVGIDRETRRQATLLALQIFYRAQVLPLASLSKENASRCLNSFCFSQVDERIVHLVPSRVSAEFFHTLFTNRILDHHYVAPILVDREMPIPKILRGNIRKNASDIQDREYFHSMGIVLDRRFDSNDVYLDEYFRPKIFCLRSLDTSQFPQSDPWTSRDQNIFCFGCIIYEVFSRTDTDKFRADTVRRGIISKRLSTPEIPENLWHLIQRCGAEDKKSRPTIDEVVKEMESWGIEMESSEWETVRRMNV